MLRGIGLNAPVSLNKHRRGLPILLRLPRPTHSFLLQRRLENKPNSIATFPFNQGFRFPDRDLGFRILAQPVARSARWSCRNAGVFTHAARAWCRPALVIPLLPRRANNKHVRAASGTNLLSSPRTRKLCARDSGKPLSGHQVRVHRHTNLTLAQT